MFGSALVQFALIWWLTEKSSSSSVLAIATLVGILCVMIALTAFFIPVIMSVENHREGPQIPATELA